MNLTDLSKMNIDDLKNLNIAEVKDALLRQKDTTISFLLIVVTVILSFFLYSQKSSNIKKLRDDLALFEKKTAAVDTLKQIQTELETLKNGFPEDISDEALIERLTDYASKYNITISSFSPSQRQNETLYDKSILSLTLNCSDYIKLWEFLKDIESSPYHLQIESWGSVLNTSGPRSKDKTEEEYSFSITLRISSIHLKDNG